MQEEKLTEQLTCFDLDGTLVDALGTLNPGAYELVETARQLGLTALCSARPMFSLERYVGLLGEFRFLSSCQGAYVVEKKNGGAEVLNNSPIPADLIKKILKISKFGNTETWMIAEEDWFSFNRRKTTDLEETILGSTSRPIGELGFQRILKVVFLETPPAVETSIRRLGLYCATSKPDFLEITANDYAKGVPMISKKHLIGHEMTACIGHGSNDIGMFGACATTITFEDSCDQIRRLAKYVVPPPSQGGLIEARKILLEQAS